MTAEGLIPVVGCWVMQRGAKGRTLGQVEDHRKENGGDRIKVRWGDGSVEWHEPRHLESGFSRGWVVQDVPVSNTVSSSVAGLWASVNKP